MLDFINLSGGVGVPYRPDQEPNDILCDRRRRKKGLRGSILVPAGMGDVAIFTRAGTIT